MTSGPRILVAISDTGRSQPIAGLGTVFESLKGRIPLGVRVGRCRRHLRDLRPNFGH
jgi:hypothetical protein